MKSEPKQQQVSYNYLTFISIRVKLSYITASVKVIKDVKGNNTLCEYYDTVCWYQKTMRSEFRKFINGKPTIQGFFFLSQTKSVELSEETSKVHELVDKKNNIIK